MAVDHKTQNSRLRFLIERMVKDFKGLHDDGPMDELEARFIAAVTVAHKSLADLRAMAGQSTPDERIVLWPMAEDDGVTIKQWYFDCGGHYIDVKLEDDGTHSVFFRNRVNNGEGWTDQADLVQVATGKLTIDVEKLLCHALGRTWAASGMSVETLIDELAARANPAVDRFTDALKQTWELVDPLTRALPGSYEKGRQQGLVDALTTIKANYGLPGILEQRKARMQGLIEANFNDPTMDAKDPYTRLFLLAEHWKREATTARARQMSREVVVQFLVLVQEHDAGDTSALALRLEKLLADWPTAQQPATPTTTK